MQQTQQSLLNSISLCSFRFLKAQPLDLSQSPVSLFKRSVEVSWSRVNTYQSSTKMSPAAGPTSVSGRHQLMPPNPICPPGAEMVAKDAILTWYRGEFAAANAIIDALCNHITDLSASRSSDYDAVFAAIHRRRLNWIPVLQMQKYFSITDVATELRKVANKPLLAQTAMVNDNKINQDDDKTCKKLQINEPLQGGEDANSDGNAGFTDSLDEDSPDSEITDTGSQEVLHVSVEQHEICDNHEECMCRREKMKMTKGFVAKEPVKGHMASS